ncbi:uncharacterized protein KRP23_13246 [Phytophthora ramorum]|uniref:uncharacterized protein n=1 Tax=Phytophthora ramorum TaxID=164328 RepID=UPI0030A189BB|nr:hypothetical protein KRP23_13246 [Phytophthora ramorum]
MKRNFGSLNLAALDLNSPFNTSADSSADNSVSLEDQFSAMDPCAEDYSMDGSEYGSDENVGFPLERMDLPATSMHSAPQSLREQAPQDVDMEDAMPDLMLPAPRPRSESGDVRVSRLMHPTSSEVPQHLHDQHHMELNALRCLSLKVMLSNLSTSNNNNNNNSANATAASKPNYAYPGAKTSLLPIRQPSLQSV